MNNLIEFRQLWKVNGLTEALFTSFAGKNFLKYRFFDDISSILKELDSEISYDNLLKGQDNNIYRVLGTDQTRLNVKPRTYRIIFREDKVLRENPDYNINLGIFSFHTSKKYYEKLFPWIKDLPYIGMPEDYEAAGFPLDSYSRPA